MPITPDDKDWTWVLERACPECGFDASTFPAATVGAAVRENATTWRTLLTHEAVDRRPSPDRWSALEYACHVRDVHLLFAERVRLMLDQDDPLFANWDQDETAIEKKYAEQDPAEVSVELVEAAADVAAVYAGVSGDQWRRPGRRSNGSVFTVATIGVYHLHDVVHHLYDIGGGAGT